MRLVAADEHGELLAAVARRHVGVAHRVAQRRPDAPQHVVAGLVPVAVVELLEVVEVEHDERELAAVAVDLGDLVVEVVDEGAVVVEAGETVAERRGREQRLHLVVLALHPAEEQAGEEEEDHPEQGLPHDAGRRRRAEAVVQDEEVAEPEGDGEAAELEEEHGAEEEREDEERPQVVGAEQEDEARDGAESGAESGHATDRQSTAAQIVGGVLRVGHRAPSQPCLGTPTTRSIVLLPRTSAAGVCGRGYRRSGTDARVTRHARR